MGQPAEQALKPFFGSRKPTDRKVEWMAVWVDLAPPLIRLWGPVLEGWRHIFEHNF